LQILKLHKRSKIYSILQRIKTSQSLNKMNKILLLCLVVAVVSCLIIQTEAQFWGGRRYGWGGYGGGYRPFYGGWGGYRPYYGGYGGWGGRFYGKRSVDSQIVNE
jgi:hypothetical protein